MSNRLRFFSAFLILTLATLACALPPLGIRATEPAGADQVATMVAATLQALTPGPTAVTPEASAGILPHTFYYLARDQAGFLQVFRLERDGATRNQLTSEPADVTDYDVSGADGTLAFVSNNQLLMAAPDGSDRRVLVDGGPVDENNPFIAAVNNPVFSPDGQTLAYGHRGLNLHAVSTGASNLVIENQIDDSRGDFVFPTELYWPERYSPDGSKLLVTLGYYEGASAAIYLPASNSLVRLKDAEGALICCDETEWSADSASFHSASSSLGMFNSGLWRVDASDGTVTTLFATDFDGSTFLFADEPYLAPDGLLYFFFAESSSEALGRAPLQLVRSEPDGVTGRTALRTETFELMTEALWAPDASFVVAAIAPSPEVYQGGRAEIVYAHGGENVVLAEFAQQMKWGP